MSLAATVGSTIAAWLVMLHRDAFLAGDVAMAAIGLTTLACVASATTLLLLAPVSLRWDTQRWHVGPPSTMGDEPSAGRLRVAVDLGNWMLLRFDAEGSGRRRARWIPVQRSSVGQAWHALRCAVYSPPPESGDPSTRSDLSASTRLHPAE